MSQPSESRGRSCVRAALMTTSDGVSLVKAIFSLRLLLWISQPSAAVRGRPTRAIKLEFNFSLVSESARNRVRISRSHVHAVDAEMDSLYRFMAASSSRL